MLAQGALFSISAHEERLPNVSRLGSGLPPFIRSELPSPEVRELPPLSPSEAGRLITLFEKSDLLNVVVFAIRLAAPIATAFPHRTLPFSRAPRIGLCTYS